MPRDFNYLEIRHLWEDAKITSTGVQIAGMNYKAVIIDTLSYIPEKAKPALRKIAKTKHLIILADSKTASYFKGALIYKTDDDLINAVSKITSPDIILEPGSANIRYRHVHKDGIDYYLLFNEENQELRTGISLRVPDSYREGVRQWIDLYSLKVTLSEKGELVVFKPHEMKILMVAMNNRIKYSKIKVPTICGTITAEFRDNGKSKQYFITQKAQNCKFAPISLKNN